MRQAIRYLIFFAILGGLTGGSMYWGYRVKETEQFPGELLAKVDRRVDAAVDRVNPQPDVQVTSIPSQMIRLDIDVAYVETGRTNNRGNPISYSGGGMASFGDDVILIAYDGSVYAASSSEDVRQTALQLPDNGREIFYAHADDPAFSQYKFTKGYLRYNDIEHFDTEAGRGILASYTEYHAEELCYTNTIARLDIDPDVTSIDEVSSTPEDWEIIYRAEPCLPLKEDYVAMEGHVAGGKMVFEAPSTIYLTAGDYHVDDLRSKGLGVHAQDPESHYGKILQVDAITGETKILSMGHRNPQGITLTSDGRIYIAEHGPKGGDELNLIIEGRNYGWPLETLGLTYRTGTQVPGTISYARHENFEAPRFAWMPSPAVSGLVYVDDFHPTWDGDMLVGSLIDRSIYRVRMDGDDGLYAERIEIGSRIRDLIIHTDGRLVLWTDSKEMIFVTPVDRASLEPLMARFVRDAEINGNLQSRLDTAVSTCAECHSFEVNEHASSPSLARVFGDPIGGTSYDGYSDALAGHGETWTRENLLAYLRDPEAFAEGTYMPSPGIEDEAVLEALVGFLASLDQAF